MAKHKGEDLRRGNAAKDVLDNELYQEAFEKVRTGLIDLLLNTEYSEGEDRDSYYMAIKSLELVQQYMESVLTTGKFAQAEH